MFQPSNNCCHWTVKKWLARLYTSALPFVFISQHFKQCTVKIPGQCPKICTHQVLSSAPLLPTMITKNLEPWSIMHWRRSQPKHNYFLPGPDRKPGIQISIYRYSTRFQLKHNYFVSCDEKSCTKLVYIQQGFHQSTITFLVVTEKP